MLKEKERKTRRGLMFAVDMEVRRRVGSRLFREKPTCNYDHPGQDAGRVHSHNSSPAGRKSSSDSRLQRGIDQTSHYAWHTDCYFMLHD